jgi:hypothetical protein
VCNMSGTGPGGAVQCTVWIGCAVCGGPLQGTLCTVQSLVALCSVLCMAQRMVGCAVHNMNGTASGTPVLVHDSDVQCTGYVVQGGVRMYCLSIR